MDKRKLAKAFKAADKNGDGILDIDEFMDYYKGQGVNLSREDAATLFAEKDRDRDNGISFDEYIGKLTDTEKAWNALDANKNGSLTRDEIKAGVKKYKKALPNIITAGNGSNFFAILDSKFPSDVLTYDDFCSLMQDAKLQDKSLQQKKKISNDGRAETPGKRPDTGALPRATSPSKTSILRSTTASSIREKPQPLSRRASENKMNPTRKNSMTASNSRISASATLQNRNSGLRRSTTSTASTAASNSKTASSSTTSSSSRSKRFSRHMSVDD